jgi:hypothetical protein
MNACGCCLVLITNTALPTFFASNLLDCEILPFLSGKGIAWKLSRERLLAWKSNYRNCAIPVSNHASVRTNEYCIAFITPTE